MKTPAILGTLAVAASLTVIAYIVGKQQFKKVSTKIKCLDLPYIRSWIASNDMEKYTSSYTVCLMRQEEIPKKYYNKLKFYTDIEKCAYICLFDKKSKNIIRGEVLIFDTISSELAADTFIELPIED